jgi:hypothetical protein
MRSSGTALLLLLMFAVGAVDAPRPALGCAPAPPKGSWVDVANETAVIIWDAKSKTEHFIRSASFTSTSADFGFLVPTPTKPELTEASPEIYEGLGKVTEPRTVVQTRTATGRLLVISHTDRGERVRIMSAREASRSERKDYEDGNFP